MTGVSSILDGATPEVLIVGAGPAGSTLAGLLVALGIEVMVLDRAHFPREKACGECLNPGGVEVLRRLGLLPAILETAPVPLAGWRLVTPEGTEAAGHFQPGVGTALGIRRGAFDHALLRAARARGAVIHEGVHVSAIDFTGPRPVVEARPVGHSTTIRVHPRILVGADGLRSVVARAAGAVRTRTSRVKASLSWRLEGPTPWGEGGIENGAAPRPLAHPPDSLGSLLLGGPFTAGLAPVRQTRSGARFLWSQTVVVDPRHYGDRLRTDREGLRREALRALAGPRADDFEPMGAPRGSGPFDRPNRWAARGSVFLVGDAAGYFDPLTGQGIYRALRSAELAAPRLAHALRPTGEGPATGAQAYDQEHREAFGPGRTLQRLIDHILERPTLRRCSIGLLSRLPGRVDTLIGVTGDRLSLRALAMPSPPVPSPEPSSRTP